MLPSAIPNFTLLERIGRGGFGEVWRADSITGKPRAVKVVTRSHFERPGLAPHEVETLFEREFEGVQRFEDVAAGEPTLITIQHVGRDEQGGFYYYVMPLADNARADGGYEALNLERKIEPDGPLDWDQAIALLRQLGTGLRALHRAGLCHGDVSSANVLFFEGQPVLADPGLTGLDGGKTLTRNPGFSDPHAPGASDHRGDLFAVGRVFYHAVTGLHPAESFPLVPPARMKELPVARLAALLDGCCDPDPAARFRDVDEFLAFLGAEPESVSPSGKVTSPRRPMLLWLGVATATLLAIGGWSMVHRRPPPVPAYVEIDGHRISVHAEAGGRLLWSKDLGAPVDQAEVLDLDDDGVAEIVCSIPRIKGRGVGRLVVYEADGRERWRYDTTVEPQNYRDEHDKRMTCSGFVAANWDGRPGKEIVVATRNAMDWYPSALVFLSHEGKPMATYWHPGHIFAEDLVFVRRTRDELPLLAFKGRNNGLGRPTGDLPRGKQKHRSVVGLLNPRVPGTHEAPPGHGKLKGRDEMTEWYRLLDPQWAEVHQLYEKDVENDGVNEIVLWSAFGTQESFVHERIHYSWTLDFAGNVISEGEGDGHVGEVKLRNPEEGDRR